MNKKKFLISLLGIFLLLLGFGLQNNSVQASTITLRATSKRAYYNVKPGKSQVDHWLDNIGIKNYIRLNHGKFYPYVSMTYTVKGKKAVHSYSAVTAKNGDAIFKKGYVYILRVPIHVSHLKPGQKYRMRRDYYTNRNYVKYHWVTKRANKKGVITWGPQVDIYLNCGTSKAHMRSVMKNKTAISNSKIRIN